MTLAEARDYAENVFSVDLDNNPYCALLKLRDDNNFLPEQGCNGELKEDCCWALIDMGEKVDTSTYGCVYYF